MSAQTFIELVRELWADDSNSTAVAIEDYLGLDMRQRSFLHDVINQRVIQRHRDDARRIERADRQPVPHTVHGSQRQGDLSHDSRLAFLEVSFALPDGRYVTWRDATVKDHEARIAMLDKQRGAIAVTADKHRAAIAQIQVNKARCLGDLYPAPAKADAA